MSETKKCPFCAEIIQFEAIKCRYCGENLEKSLDKYENKSSVPSKGKKRKKKKTLWDWLLISLVLVILLIKSFSIPGLWLIILFFSFFIGLYVFKKNLLDKNSDSILIRPIGGKVIIILIILIPISCGFFHIVPNYLLIFPKSHFSYSYTFVDVDEVIVRHNNQNLGERIRGNELFDNLVSRLKEKGIIHETERKSIDLDF